MNSDKLQNTDIPNFDDTEPMEDLPKFEETSHLESNNSLGQNTPMSSLAAAGYSASSGWGPQVSAALLSLGNLGQEKLHDIAPSIIPDTSSQIDEELLAQGFTGDLKPKTTLELYRELRDSARQTQKEAQQEHPVASTIGAIGGGLALGSGLGALTKAGGALGTAASYLTSPLGQAAEGAGLLTRMGTGALNALPMSAALSVGLSDADLTKGEIVEAAKDIAKGGITGALVGGAIPLAGAAVSGTVKTIGKLKSIPPVDTFIKSMKKASEGIDLKSPEFLVQSRDQLKNIADDLNTGIRSNVKNLFNEQQEILKKLEQEGIKVDSHKVVNNLTNDLLDLPTLTDDEIKLISKAMPILDKPQSVLELNRTIKTIKDLKGRLPIDSAQEKLNEAADRLVSIRDNLSPDISQINNKLFELIDAGEALMGKNPLDYLNSREVMTMKENLSSKFEQILTPKQESLFTDIFQKGLKTSKGVKVSPLEEQLPSTKSTLSKVKEIAENIDLSKKISEPLLKDVSLSHPFRSAGKIISSGAGKVGALAGETIKQSKDFVVTGAQTLSKSSAQELNQMGEKLLAQSSAVAKEYGNVLKQAATKNPTSRSALIYSLMQQPTFRELYLKNFSSNSIED